MCEPGRPRRARRSDPPRRAGARPRRPGLSRRRRDRSARRARRATRRPARALRPASRWPGAGGPRPRSARGARRAACGARSRGRPATGCAAAPDEAHREQRVVGEGRARPDDDRVVPGAKPVHETLLLGPAQPARAAIRSGHAPVERDHRLEGDPRKTRRAPLEVGRIERAALLIADAEHHLHAGLTKRRDSLPVHERIGVEHADHDAADSGGQDRVHTGGRAPHVRAGLERDHERRSRGGGAGSLQGARLGVRLAGALVPARDDRGSAEDDRPHARIGWVVPIPRRARRIAAAMARSSAALAPRRSRIRARANASRRRSPPPRAASREGAARSSWSGSS